jgi:hypothetical protein
MEAIISRGEEIVADQDVYAGKVALLPPQQQQSNHASIVWKQLEQQQQKGHQTNTALAEGLGN